MSSLWKYLAILLVCTTARLQIIQSSEQGYLSRRPAASFKWSQPIRGEYIPLSFYGAARTVEESKQVFQNQLRNFLENLQKNLTMSDVFMLPKDVQRNAGHQRKKINELSEFFYTTAEVAKMFARDLEMYYETAKNSSYTLLLQLRQIPSAQPIPVKILLTNYFAEMEFFHIIFSEIMDEALEYTQCILLATARSFTHYADIQRFVLQNWHFKSDVACCKEYMEFLKQYSAQIFKCNTERGVGVAFDVFAMSQIASKFVMRQLEFRVQRLFNCLYLGDYEIRCKFLQNAEKDFENLFNALEELEMFYDIRMKKGRVSSFRKRRQEHFDDTPVDELKPYDECMPKDFPLGQMSQNLKTCFHNITEY